MFARMVMLYYAIPLLTFACIALFWRIPVALFFLLAVISFIAIKDKRELAFFIVFGVFATIADILIVRSGAWSYAIWHLDGIPYWIFLAYGLIAMSSLLVFREFENMKFD